MPSGKLRELEKDHFGLGINGDFRNFTLENHKGFQVRIVISRRGIFSKAYLLTGKSKT